MFNSLTRLAEVEQHPPVANVLKLVVLGAEFLVRQPRSIDVVDRIVGRIAVGIDATEEANGIF